MEHEFSRQRIAAPHAVAGACRSVLPAARLLGAILAILTAIAPLDAAERPKEVLAEIGITPRLGAQVPLDTPFVDHRGAAVSLRQLAGRRPLVLCLVYFRCPMLCNLTAEGLVRAVSDMPDTVGHDFDVVMVSFDPRDKPQQAAAARLSALQRYGRPEASGGWHALTGDASAIAELTAAVGFRYRWDSSTEQYAHAAGLIVLTPEGRISSYADGIRFAPRELSAAIQNASNQEVASSAPTTFLRCYLYDPTTGRFGAVVQWTIRGLGLLTVVGLGAGITRMAYRERQLAIYDTEANR